MSSLKVPPMSDFEDIVYRTFGEVQVVAAIHSTKLGPALGGCRIAHYNSFEDHLNDTLRLSEGMSYKNALGDIPFGGGKMTVNIPTGMDVSNEQIVNAIAKTVNDLDGKYYTAKDVGFNDHVLNALNIRGT